MCCARRGALSQREKVTGRAFDRQIGSTKGEDRYADCRIRTGFALDRHICYATGDRKWPSGESRMIRETTFGFIGSDAMRLFLSILIAFFALSSSAYGDWGYTSWGMSPEQVLTASSGKAYKNDNIKGESTDDAYALLKAPYSAGRFSFEAYFLFDKTSNKLTTVNLELLNPKLGHSLHGALMSKYGAPISRNDGGITGLSTWRDEESNNHISWLRIGSDYFSLQYKPIKSEQTKGL